MDVEAGWYPDPSGTAARFRWWDGSAWSRWLSRSASAPAPSDPVAPAPPPARTVGVAAAIALVVGVLALAVLVVAGTVALTSPVVGTGPAVDPPPRKDAPYLLWQSSTRQIQVQSLSIVLPDAPWLCPAEAETSGAYTSVVRCTVVVHENYKGNEDWGAESGVGLLARSSFDAKGGSLKAIGERVVSSLRASSYAGVKTTLLDYKSAPTPYGPKDQVLLLTGKITYRVPGLSSTTDALQVLVVKLPSGDHAVYFSTKPLDASAPITRSLQATADSLQIR